MTDQGERDDRVSNLINKICDWAGKHPELYEYPEEAVMEALRNFVIKNKIKLEE